MEKVELMTVEDTFLIESIGLMLAPSFDLPPVCKRVNINETITIQTTEGKYISAEALFSVAYLNIKDPSVSGSKRRPILLSLKGVSKESMPVGSTIYVTQSKKLALAGLNV